MGKVKSPVPVLYRSVGIVEYEARRSGILKLSNSDNYKTRDSLLARIQNLLAHPVSSKMKLLSSQGSLS